MTPRRISHYPRRDGPLPEGAIWVGRPSRFGNPHDWRTLGRAEAVRRYRQDLAAGLLPITGEDMERLAQAEALACACPQGEPCHAEALVDILATGSLALRLPVRETCKGVPAGRGGQRRPPVPLDARRDDCQVISKEQEAETSERSERGGADNLHIGQEERSDLVLYGDQWKQSRSDGPFQGGTRASARTRRGADGRYRARSEAARFWEKVTKQADGCWVWTAATDRDGYGTFKVKRDGHWVPTKAHRWTYQQLVGDTGGLPLDHLCRNRACVNPAHLEPVSTTENARRARQSPPAPPGTPQVPAHKSSTEPDLATAPERNHPR